MKATAKRRAIVAATKTKKKFFVSKQKIVIPSLPKRTNRSNMYKIDGSGENLKAVAQGLSRVDTFAKPRFVI